MRRLVLAHSLVEYVLVPAGVQTRLKEEFISDVLDGMHQATLDQVFAQPLDETFSIAKVPLRGTPGVLPTRTHTFLFSQVPATLMHVQRFVAYPGPLKARPFLASRMHFLEGIIAQQASEHLGLSSREVALMAQAQAVMDQDLVAPSGAEQCDAARGICA